MSKPVVVDLCCGLGGWSKAFLDEGWDAIGFDIERHEYEVPGRVNGVQIATVMRKYPGELILKSILELNGYDLKHSVNPALIVASPPCQRYSYMAMPFSRGKREGRWQRWERDSPFGDRLRGLNALFNACFRIARECGCPIVLENVKGAQPWVGRAKANYGSYYLWGDVANVGGRIVRRGKVAFGMPAVKAFRSQKVNPDGTQHGTGPWFAVADSRERGASQGRKVEGFNFHQHENGGAGGSFQTASVKAHAAGSGESYGGDSGWDGSAMRTGNSKSPARKAASAMIAEIPYDLAQHIARVFHP